jgi:hypothetical protein
MTLRFFDRLDELDKLLERGPDAVSFASEILPLLEDEWARRYFLSQISNPAWLPILKGNGLFDTIPPQGRGIFPSDLLKRLAVPAPTAVMEIIATLPDTENEWIHMDLLKAAAIALDRAESEVASWAEREASWIRARDQLDVLVVEPAARLATALCGVRCEIAFTLAEALLDLSCMPEERQRSLRVKPRMDEWSYQDALKQLQEPLTAACGGKALRLFMRLLIQAAGETDVAAADLMIHMWRPAVEDAKQNAPNSLLNWLVVAVRDSAHQLVESDGVAVLDILETDLHKTFHRVALHVRRIKWNLDAGYTVRIATSTPILQEPLLRHELLLLVKEKFEEFPQRFKNCYFAFVRQLEEPVERLRFLHPVAEHITGALKEDYESLRREFDSQDILDPLEGRSFSFVGPISPISVDEMKKVSVSELVEQIKTWKPGSEFGSGSPEGLARQLGEYAEQEATALSARADEFIGVDPTYVRGLANGLSKALKDKDAIEGFSWEGVLLLCDKAVRDPWEKQQGSGSFDDFDETWAPARLEVARLLEAGLRHGEAGIPAELLPTTWGTLGKLLEDLDPTKEEEVNRLESMDPATIAINTIRGTAMQGLMYYAFRKRQSICKSPPFPPMSEFAPEVVEKLELHLDPAKESSLAVRSVYGKWLPQLYGLDKDWTVASLDRIFPRDDVHLWEAAWDAYMAFSQVYMDLLPVLRPLYERAAWSIGEHSEDLKARTEPDKRLGGHLVLYYRHGALELDDPLLSGFFDEASDDLRHSVLTDAVRGIQDLKDEDLALACQRLKLLWERRVEETKGGDATREWSAFCWWFIKKQFEPAWALGQLALALERGAELELEGSVLSQLRELAVEYPHEVFECLDLIVQKSEKPNWGLYNNEVKEILRVILASDDDLLRECAEDLLHHIGSLGFLSFRELLQAR